jgi:hypothetical protein
LSATTTAIEVPFPEVAERRLQLAVGPGKLRLSPGGAEPWVSGSYTDPTGALPCRITTEGGTARISQDHQIPRSFGGVPAFDLRLGTAQSYALSLEAGAIDAGECELGGLPLTRLEVRYGAGRANLTFSAPNPNQMDRLLISAGAAETTARGLLYANAAEIRVEGGAAAFTLDLSGEPMRDTAVRINTGLAAVELRVPAAVAVKITPHAVLGNVEAGDGFTTRDGGYWTAAAIAGVTPVVSVNASVALGALKLRAT